MSRELTALLEALRLEQLEKGSLTVADEIKAILDFSEYDPDNLGKGCPVCARRYE